jgi:hypothetical protein
MKYPFNRSVVGNVWRRWPITIVTTTLAVPIASWAYIHLSAPSGPTFRSHIAEQNIPAKPSGAVPGPRQSHTHALAEKQHVLPAFRRVPVGTNEVDYVAEDVTVRIFTPPPKPHPVPRGNNKVDIGDDVTVRYFADKRPGTPER